MKSPADAITSIRRRLERQWAVSVVGGSDEPWPHSVALGVPSTATMIRDWATVRAWADRWRDWHTGHPSVALTWTERVVAGTRQPMPTHVTVPTRQVAAALTGSGWPQQLQVAEQRWAVLAHEFPDTASVAVLKAAATLPEVDFEVLVSTVHWFADHDAAGLTPRQVPVPGLHAKWLDRHRALVADLVGHPLGIVDRPVAVTVTYLDPGHAAAGGRRYDAVTLTDRWSPPYPVRVVVVTENKDTMLFFPDVPGGIAVHGTGKMAGLLPQVPWLTSAPVVLYWGDIDAEGFEIVDLLRSRGLPVTTMLMDTATYDTYQRFGTNTAPNGASVARPRRDLLFLTTAERMVYDRITAPQCEGVRRVEQERIPYSDAVRYLTQHTGLLADPNTA